MEMQDYTKMTNEELIVKKKTIENDIAKNKNLQLAKKVCL